MPGHEIPAAGTTASRCRPPQPRLGDAEMASQATGKVRKDQLGELLAGAADRPAQPVAPS